MTTNQTAKPTLPFSIVLPLLIGLTAFILLYTSINNGTLNHEMVKRYLAGHAVSKVTTAMFLVGFASLCLIGWDILRQRKLLGAITLREQPFGQPAEGPARHEPASEQLRFQLNRYQGAIRRTYLWRRLFTSLDFVHRNGTPDGLDEELKYATDQDLDEKHDRYSFVRILIWAIPMLGFLGTVLGISEALGGIEISDDNDFSQMMGGLRSSLYVAFDTTAVALTFAILLMFTQFGVDRMESALLTRVDARTREELSSHWEITNQSKDSYVQTVEAIGASMLESTEKLVDKQVKLWRGNIDAAESAWVDTVSSAQTAARENLQGALDESTEKLAGCLQESIKKSDEAVSRRWEQWQVALSENARILLSHQEQLVEHSRTMMTAMENVGSIAESKQALIEYLEAMPSTAEYAEASRQLSTAVRLLEFRLSQAESSTADKSKANRQSARKAA